MTRSLTFQRRCLRLPRLPVGAPLERETNGLLRQYFPKRTDVSIHRAGDLKAVEQRHNHRARKTLGWLTPTQIFTQPAYPLPDQALRRTSESALEPDRRQGVNIRPSLTGARLRWVIDAGQRSRDIESPGLSL